MKILWLSNKQILNIEITGSGSWITAMANSLALTEEIMLVNITESNVDHTIVMENYNQKEYILPKCKINKDGLPNKNIVDEIIEIVRRENPDIIHVWGVENYWGLLVSRGYLSGYHFLLDIQGVLEACYEFYTGNLCLNDYMSCMKFPSALYAYLFIKMQKIRMWKRVKFENEIIKAFTNIACQSEWVKGWIKYKNPFAKLYFTEIAVRHEFLDAKVWESNNAQHDILLVASQQAYKRIDVALKALHVIKITGKKVRLIIVGDVLARKKGYSMYLISLIKKLELEQYVEFVGSKNADEIILLAKEACCMVVPSSVESYSLVMAESMALGIPVVASYAGAIPEFCRNTYMPIFFPSGDYVSCATLIMNILKSQELRIRISRTEIELWRNKRCPAITQLAIYKKILGR